MVNNSFIRLGFYDWDPGYGDVSENVLNYCFQISWWLDDWDVCLIFVDMDGWSISEQGIIRDKLWSIDYRTKSAYRFKIHIPSVYNGYKT